MQEKIIDFETAKLAKEVGFSVDIDESTYYYITETHGKYPWQEEGSLERPLDHLDAVCYDSSGIDYFSKAIVAPTQSLLQKWLRENHDIVVAVVPTHPDGPFKALIDTPEEDLIELTGFSNWEKCLEAGLVEALKQIKV